MHIDMTYVQLYLNLHDSKKNVRISPVLGVARTLNAQNRIHVQWFPHTHRPSRAVTRPRNLINCSTCFKCLYVVGHTFELI